MPVRTQARKTKRIPRYQASTPIPAATITAMTMHGPATTSFHQPTVAMLAPIGAARRQPMTAIAPATIAMHNPTISIVRLVPPTIARSAPAAASAVLSKGTR